MSGSSRGSLRYISRRLPHRSPSADGDMSQVRPCAAAQSSSALVAAMSSLLGQDRLHLLQGEAQVFQRDDAVQLGELSGLVEAVPGGRVDAGRTEQADRVVVPEHADRYPAVPCELP